MPILLAQKDNEYKKTLLEHRNAIKDNPNSYTDDLERCERNILTHLKMTPSLSALTESRVKKSTQPTIMKRLVTILFEAQNKKPFFHIEKSTLPMCWNAPKDWNKDYIKYEWGHLFSINQSGTNAHNIENISLQSARCNQHIQTSMNVDELLVYGGELASIIERNLETRQKLFNSQEWIDLRSDLQTLNQTFIGIQ
tara:strand:- start:36 stop:623 length:588 start_codon:yes stop_codon:yes gene_type:complete